MRSEPRGTRLLIVSPDIVAKQMAGPGIRYWEFARVLSAEFDVTLAIPGASDLQPERFRLKTYNENDPGSLSATIETVDVIVVTGYLLDKFPALKSASQPLVVDLINPFSVENLEIHLAAPVADQVRMHYHGLSVTNELLKRGDLFICASEKQRDFWLGALLANGRINPYTYRADKTLNQLVRLVPFGLPSVPPRHDRQVLKGVYETIEPTDKVILWEGGVWNWLDGLTPIRAMRSVAQVRPDVKLFFMGTRHPDDAVAPDMQMRADAIRLAEELGLLGQNVFFHDWIPYEERANYLLESDVGIYLHFKHLETRLSFRQRFLDYVWAGLPVIITKGDAFGELVEREGLGETVDFGDAEQAAEAILKLSAVPDLQATYRPCFEAVARDFAWEKVVEPLAAFCRNPQKAADRVASPLKTGLEPSQWGRLVRRAWWTARRKGLGGLWREVRSYWRWRSNA